MKSTHRLRVIMACIAIILCWASGAAQDSLYNAMHYVKHEYRIPMRDGAKLFTAVYVPVDTSHDYPILMLRTPYSIGPYGEQRFAGALGPSPAFAREGFIFVFQDVRGRFMSEGEFTNMRPQHDVKRTRQDIDESSDTYDTIEWLLHHIAHHNGRVGMWGISYPGFYASAGMINSHPALKAVSPQAPIADWFVGDDDHHNGAFFLLDAFLFYPSFGRARHALTTDWPSGYRMPSPDAYAFLLNAGAESDFTKRLFGDDLSYWDSLSTHGSYDYFWKERNILPHLKNISCASLIVGGWFDAEDLYGTLNTYAAVERQNPGTSNTLVMGPWPHGGWEGGDGRFFGDMDFGSSTALFYRDSVIFPFFVSHLKGAGDFHLPEALVFETGTDAWRHYDRWPPSAAVKRELYFRPAGALGFTPPKTQRGELFDAYVSDPQRPVPYMNGIPNGRPAEYMIEDQRFASRRPDVLVYQTSVLDKRVTLAGPMEARLYVSTTGTDCDWVVKVIDVFPDTARQGEKILGGYQMLVRAEVMRSKFRNSMEKPEPVKPNTVTEIRYKLLDINHAFLPGHRIMVQIQSSWFPLVDRNPQQFTDIYHARPGQFRKAGQRVFHSNRYPSAIIVGVMP